MSNITVGAICGVILGATAPAYGIITGPGNDNTFWLLFGVILVALLGGIGALVGAAVDRQLTH